MPLSPTVSRPALFMLVALTLIWGTNWPLFSYAVREVSVWTFRSVSMLSAGALLLAISRARGASLWIPRSHWPAMAIATFCYLVVWNVASTYAAVLIPSGQAAVLGFTMPLWAALFSWAVLGERPTGRMLLAIVLGGLAVVLLMLPSFGSYAAAPLGLALGLASGMSWAVGTLVVKRARIPVPVLVLTGWQLIFGALPITAAALVLGDGHWFMPSWQSVAVIAYITLFPMLIGNVCWFAIVGLLPANVAGVSMVMVPVVAMLSGALVHAEPLGPLQLASMALCVSALVLALTGKTT